MDYEFGYKYNLQKPYSVRIVSLFYIYREKRKLENDFSNYGCSKFSLSLFILTILVTNMTVKKLS